MGGGGRHGDYFALLRPRRANVHIEPDATQNHDLTLHFPEGSHSQRVAEDVMADLHPAFVLLLLPLCHLLRYRRAAGLARCGALRRGGALRSLRGRGEPPPTPVNGE